MNRLISSAHAMTTLRGRRRRTGSKAPPRTAVAQTIEAPHENENGFIALVEPAELNSPTPLVFTTEVYEAIEQLVGGAPAETGGPLGGRRGSTVVEEFSFDTTAYTNGARYYPDIAAVNQLLQKGWNPAGVNLLGFVHSHPAGFPRPSNPDLVYAERIMAAIPELGRLCLPIVQTVPDVGSFQLHGWSAVRHINEVVIERQDVHVLPGWSPVDLDAPRFERVQESYDLRAMATSRFVAIGCGGSASFLEDLARTGVGEFVLVDPDRVEAPNLGTQQTFVTDIGQHKGEAIARRIRNVNPDARVWVVPARLEELTDEAMVRMTRGWMPGPTAHVPRATVLGAFTDDFGAQARVARVGLHAGVPVVTATVYRGGLGVEVAFAAAGITPACIRCALRSRYVAYLENGFRNDVTSHGTPYHATMRLNALKMPIVLGLLHSLSSDADPEHPATRRHRRFLESVSDRNLALVSLDPDLGTNLGLRLFDDIAELDPRGRLLVDATAWLQQLPDNPDNGYPFCGDCGGSGDLERSVSSFEDTRPMPHLFGEHRIVRGPQGS